MEKIDMGNFDKAVEFVLKREGGLSENLSDLGGITNFGISLRFLREVLPENLRRYGIFEEVNDNTIRELTQDQAKFIYRGEFWENLPLDDIESQAVASYIFDMVVNHGISLGIKLVQRSICAAAFDRDFIKDDGIMGPKTIAYINSYNDSLLLPIVATRAEYYRSLAIVRKSDESNLDGWLNRCYAVF